MSEKTSILTSACTCLSDKKPNNNSVKTLQPEAQKEFSLTLPQSQHVSLSASAAIGQSNLSSTWRDNNPLALVTLVKDAVPVSVSSELSVDKKLPKRVVVFHGGLLDGDNSHPNAMVKVWEANGVPKEQIIVMPNCYPCEEHISPVRKITEKSMPPAYQPPHEPRANSFLGRRKQDAKKLFGKAVHAGKSLAVKTYNLGVRGINAVKDRVSYTHGVVHCLDKYDRLNDPNSDISKERIETLNKILKERGYSPENPAEVSFVGHSGGVSPGRRLAMASNQPNSGLCFKVAELTFLGSPATEKVLTDIPKSVEVNYVVSTQDDLFKGVFWATNIMELGNVKSLITKKPSQIRVVSDVKPYLQDDDELYTNHSPGHRAYHFDTDLLKRLIPDTMSAGNPPALKQVVIPR